MISIIYVYYNNSDVIFDSINSVLNSKTKIDYEIIVVINKCTDIKIEELQKISSKISIIENETNLGFGKANNIGVKNSKGNYVLILNPDTLLHNDVLDTMYEIMVKDKEIGGSICKLVDENNNLQETVIRKKIDFMFFVVQLFFLFKIPLLKRFFNKKYYYSKSDFLVEQFPDVISGAFMLFRKDIYLQVNGFDENFFMYVEDIDLSKRVKEISKLYYYPNVSINHIGDTTLGNQYVKDKIIMNYTSLFYFIQKFYGKRKLFFFKILVFLNGLLFMPFAKLIKKEKTKNMIINRSKLFVNVFNRKFYNA